jgi:phosphoglucomutase
MLEQSITDACRSVAQLIKQEGGFAEIYLVPSGYGVLLQKIAETVFQITGKTATTLHYDRKSNSYWAIRIDLRAIIAQA